MAGRIFIYATRGSDGARDLVRELGGKRLKRPTQLKVGDLVVNWGETYPAQVQKGARVLNPRMTFNKLKELTRLELKGVKVPRFSYTEKPGWVGRMHKHTGGEDLLHPPLNPAFYVQRLNVVREFRIHVFGGISIRAGMKVPRVADPHPWVRSYDGGWKLDYGEVCQKYLKQKVRDAAKAAVAALELDFGAVDVGLLADGTVVVFEVNKAPGLEGNTLQVYVNKIKGVFSKLNGGGE